MTTAVGAPARNSAVGVGAPAQNAGIAAAPIGAPLPDPTTSAPAALDAINSMCLATVRQRDKETLSRQTGVEVAKSAREAAFKKMQEEIQKAKEAQEHKGFLGGIIKVVDSACDALVGGNPLQDIAKGLDDLTGGKVFEVAYDFLRPDAILHGAAMLAGEALHTDKVTQAYDLTAATSSLKTRFSAVADATGEEKVMDAYAGVRDVVAGAMVTVGTCGTGTAAMVAIALSAAMTLESKVDLLGAVGVHGDVATGIRLGMQAASLAGNVAGTVMSGVKTGAVEGAKVATAAVNGANSITRGSVEVGQAIYQYQSDTHMARSAAQQNVQHQQDRTIDRMIKGMQQLAEAYQHSLATFTDAINTQDQTTLSIARSIA